MTTVLKGIVCIAVFVSVWMMPQYATSMEQVIVFVQSSVSDVADVFQKDHLPKIANVSEKMGIDLRIVPITDAAPPEITITPLIVYQNHWGRAIYQGRTATPDRFRNFVRTSRHVPQGAELNIRKDIPIWTFGRTRIWAPLKIAGVTGTLPDNYHPDAFVKEATTAVLKGFKQFRMTDRAELGRSDRGFYMDFYPWVSQDNTLFLSLALFSQFHCKTPVFKTVEPITGPWDDRGSLIEKAAGIMEKAVENAISDPHVGDGFDPVKEGVRSVSWEEIGFPLPPAPEKSMPVSGNFGKLPRNWVLISSGPDDPPMVQFRFPPPLDQYAGEATSGTGEFRLPENLDADGASGFVKIDPKSATMGDPILDEAMRGSMILDTKNHSESKFVIETGIGQGQTVAYGNLANAGYSGTFTLKGKTVPVTAATEIEPVLNETGEPLLLIRGAFQIDLTNFGIQGVDGPAPENHTLMFDVNFKLKPE